MSREETDAIAMHLGWTLQPQSVAVGDGHGAAIVLQLSAPDGSPMPGAQLTVVPDAHLQVLSGFGATDGNGQTSGRVTCVQPGAVVLRATTTIAGISAMVPGTGQLLCTATNSVADANATTGDLSQINFVALQTVAAADAGAPTSITMVVTDAAGKPLAHQVVTIATTRAGDAVYPTTAVTDAQGRATVALSATTLGDSQVVVTCGQTSATANIHFVAGAPQVTASAWQARGPAAIADGDSTQPIDLMLRDAAGNGVPYAAVQARSDAAGDILEPPSGLTNAMGQFTTLLTGTVAGVRVATVTGHTGTLSTPVTLIPGPAAAATSVLSLNPNVITADGVSQSYITVVAADARGNRAAAQNVLLYSSDSNDAFVPRVGVTDSSGQWTSAVTGVRAGSHTLTAQMGNTVFSSTLHLLAGAPSSQGSTLMATPGFAIAGAPVELTLSVVDARGNPVAGLMVQWTGLGGSYSFAPANIATDATGRASSQLTGTVAATVRPHATVAGLDFNTPVVFVPGSANAAQSTITISPNVLVADGNHSATVSAHFNDAFGNAVSSVGYTWAASAANTTVSPSAGNASTSGDYVGTVTSWAAQAQILTVTVGDVSLSSNVTFTTGPPASLTLTASPNAGIVSNGNAPSTLTAQVLDAQGRPTSGYAVRFTANSPDAALFPAKAVSNGLGLATSQLTSVVAGNRPIHAQQGTLGDNANVVFAARTPACSGNVILGVYPTYMQLSGAATAMAAIDMDNDGRPDIVTSGSYAPGIHVAYSGGNHTIAKMIGAGNVAHVSGFVAINLNGDALPDLVVVNNANFIQTFLGAPGRALAANVTYGQDGNFVGICAGDINQDGYQDVVAVSAANPPGFAVFLGNGAGVFGAASFYAATGGRPVGCVAVDLNGDSYTDVALVNNGNNAIDVYAGNSGHTFAGPVSYAVGASPNTLAVADFNGDTVLDLVATNGNTGVGTISVLLGNGSGGYLPQAVYTIDHAPNDLKLVDINQDGHLDLVVATGYQLYAYGDTRMPDGIAGNSVNFMLGRGDGTFAWGGRLPGGGSLTAAAVADFDGDTWLDVALGMGMTTGAGVAFGTGNLTFAQVNQYLTPLASNVLKFADVNGDGHIDIIGANTYDSTVGVFIGSPNGQLNPPQRLSGIVYNHGIGLADIDGDGYLDYLGIGNDGQNMSVGMGVGNGNFVLSNLSYASTALNYASAFDVMTQDINGDGLDDAVLVNEGASGLVTLVANGGNSIFNVVAGTYPSGQVPCRNAGTFADLNNDGYVDLILPCAQLLVFMGDGSGNYNTSTAYPSTSSNFKTLVAIDVDRDGFVDIAAENSYEYVIFHNSGGTTLVAEPKVSFAQSGDGLLTTGDLNGDGYEDLIKSNGTSISLFYGTGAGGLGTEIQYPAGLVRAAYGVDYDGDGQQDLVAAAVDQGLVVYLAKGCTP